MFKKRTRNSIILAPILLFLIIISTWEIADRIFDFNAVILPSPSEIYRAFNEHYIILFKETSITMVESILGFLLGSIIAYLLAILFTFSNLARDALYPYAIALKSTPLIAIAPLLVLWFGNGMFSKVIMSALVAFFPVLVNSVNGLNAVPKELLDLMKSLSASPWKVLIKVRIPYSLDYLFSSLKIASSLAVVGAVIGEFIGSTEGIGYLINTSSYYLETALMFAGIIMISIGGILFFGIISYLERKIVFWKENN